MSSEQIHPDETPGLLPHAGEGSEERGIDLIALTAAVISEWRLGTITFLVTLVLAAAIIFSLTPQFVATASILPEESHGPDATLFSLFSTRGPGALYIGLLKSRSVQNVVVERAHLLALFNTSSYETARDVLSSRSSFTEGADSLITINVKDASAQNAAMIAEAYLEGLTELNKRMGMQQSRQTNEFFDEQLQTEKGNLATAESELEQTQKKTGVIQPEAQTQIALNAIGATRAQINTLNAQLAALLQSSTDRNPDVVRLRSQIGQLQAQERVMEQSGSTPPGAAPSADAIPQSSLDIARAQRQVKYHDTLVTSLANQYANARLTQDLSQSAFQVIDHAVVPEHKDWPPRKPFLIAGIAMAGLMGFFIILLRLLYRRITTDPAHRTSLMALQRAFHSR